LASRRISSGPAGGAVPREQVFVGDRSPALVIEGGVYEDCTFVCDEFWSQVVVIRGDATLRRCRVEGGNNHGIVVEGGSVLVEDCVMTGSRVGIYASGSVEVTVRRCLFEGPGSLGILLRRGATGTVEDCTMVGIADAAFMARSGSRAVVRRCELSSGNVGVHLESWAEVSDCLIRDSRVGVWIGPGAPIVRDCRIEGCFSIGVYFTAPATVERCALVGNHIGLCLYIGGDPRVVDCTIDGGDNMGLLALDGAAGVLERCRFGPHPNGEKVMLSGASTRIID
jgi:hypothetical protein